MGGAVQFTDAKGRVWRPRLTAGVVADFEKATGINFFGAVFRLIATADGKNERALLAACTEPFGSMQGVLILLYEGCRDSRGQVCDINGNPVTLDSFANAIGPEESSGAMKAAMLASIEFFPKADPDDQGQTGAEGEQRENPRNGGAGDGSTK